MNDEIAKWFTEHGQVISADTVEDKASAVPGASLIQYTFADGAKLTIRAAKYDNGQQVAPQEIVSRELPKPKPAADQSPSQQNEAELNRQRQKNAALPADQDPRYETDEQRAERAKQTIKEQGAQAEKDAKEREAANKPTITIKPVKQPDGSTKNVQVRVYPDGREEVVPSAIPGDPAPDKGEKPKYSQVKQDEQTGKWYGLTPQGQWEEMQGGPTGAPGKKYVQTQQDKDTGKWYGLTPDGKWEPMEGGPGAGSGVTLPPGMARPQFTAGEVANELAATRDKLDAWVAEGKDDAERASRKAEALNAMKEAHQLATTYLTEQAQLQGTATSTFGTQVSQRGQDVSMVNQRTSAGASMANQAVSSFVPMLRYAQAGSGDPVKAFMALMGLMRENVGAMGGLVDLPRVGVPSAIPASAQGQPQPSQTGTNVVNGAPSGLPPIVRGAAQQQAAPGVTIQVNAPPPPEAPATPPLPPPLLGPQPEVQLPPPAVMQKVFDLVEPMMAQDPSWGVDDLGLIQQGVGPLDS